MKFDKTTIVGIAICVLLFLSWNRILRSMGYDTTPRPAQQEAPAPQPEEQAATPDPTAAKPGDPAAPEAEPKVADVPTETPVPAAKPEPVAATPTSDALLEQAQMPWPIPEAEPVVLVSADGTLVLRVDPNGGGVTSVVLNDYFTDAEKGGPTADPVVIGRSELPFCALNLAQAGWTAGPGEVLVKNAGQLRIQRPITGPTGETAVLTEAWTMAGDAAPYQFDYSIRVDAASEQSVILAGLAVEGGGLPSTTSPQRRKFRQSSASGVMSAVIGAKRPQGFDAGKLGKMKPAVREELRTAPSQWLGVHSQYFLFHVAAPEDSSFSGALPTLETFKGDPTVKVGRKIVSMPWYRGRAMLPDLTVEPGGSTTLAFRCYAGPKKLQILTQMPGDVDKVMGIDRFMFFNAGWMAWLTKLLLGCLVGLKTVFSGAWGYGWAIIIITVGVKLIFFPLSHKSTQSMRKMQELQPQLKVLKENYKDDPQKMYRKQQELFKENNVSQLGGCLPMLVQIPVFFALYNTFRSAIELRQASFLWVADLSLPDTLAFSPEGLPIRPLALIMSGSMLLQNKLMPSGEPSQRRMMMFMSLFMLWIFYGMPAGLTLYWTTNQLLTICQTLITRRLEEKKKARQANSGEARTETA